ncbi:MAG: DUF3383 domain-containing protein [Desulfobulbaceae bacterium]|nr:DUF3383 domain-containing protein [Desulfobulbaceae bacterium]
MAVQSTSTITNYPFILDGNPYHRDNETILQDAGRATPLVYGTVMSQIASTSKWVPLTDVSPALTAAKMVCGTNGGNLAAWQAVGDGSFKITVDGILHDITGLVFTAVASLADVVGIIQSKVAGKFDVFYDQVANVFTFASPTFGVSSSSITVLTAGSAGTDISGAGFLNGLTGTGTVTAATGGTGSELPSGIYFGDDITAAKLVAGDVTGPILVGSGVAIDESQIVLENSLTLNSIVSQTMKTIRATLASVGILAKQTTTTTA